MLEVREFLELINNLRQLCECFRAVEDLNLPERTQREFEF